MKDFRVVDFVLFVYSFEWNLRCRSIKLGAFIDQSVPQSLSSDEVRKDTGLNKQKDFVSRLL